jgi:archaellin
VRVLLDAANALESLVETFAFHRKVPSGMLTEIELAVRSESGEELVELAAQAIAGMPGAREEVLVKYSSAVQKLQHGSASSGVKENDTAEVACTAPFEGEDKLTVTGDAKTSVASRRNAATKENLKTTNSTRC